MKQKIAKLLLSALIVFGVSFTSMSSSYAAEGEGGQVYTEGVVGFYTDEVQESSSTKTSTSTSTTTPVTKPTGKLPSTGELVKTGAVISGVVVLVAVFIFILWKRKKDEEEGRENL